MNSIYMSHIDEVNRAQSEADKFVNHYTQCTTENRPSDKEYRTKSSMITYLPQTTKEAILTDLDQLCILATFERKEHIEDWELALPPLIEESTGKTKQRKDDQGNPKIPDATRSTESHHISCRQCGLPRRMGFQAKFFHQESSLCPTLEEIGIEPSPETDQAGKPLFVFEPMAHHGMKVLMRRLSDIGGKLSEVTSIINTLTKMMKQFGIDCVKIDNTNGKLASSSLEPKAYEALKESIIQDYHKERVRLIDTAANWFKARGQYFDHTLRPTRLPGLHRGQR